MTNSSGYASSVYPNFSPFGINGGYYYGKVTYSF
jgi:iron complex outermembrane receptor protein